MNKKCAERSVKCNRFTINVLRKIASELGIDKFKTMRKAQLCDAIYRAQPDLPLIPPSGFKNHDSTTLVKDLMAYQKSLSNLTKTMKIQGEININALIKSFNAEQQKVLKLEQELLQELLQERQSAHKTKSVATDMAKLKRAHADELKATEDLMNRELQSLQDAHASDLAELQSELQNVIDQKGDVEVAMDAVKQVAQEELIQYNESLNKLKKQHAGALDARKKQHQKDLSILKKQQKDDKQLSDREIASLTATIGQYTVQIEQLQNNISDFKQIVLELKADKKSNIKQLSRARDRITNWRTILRQQVELG